MIILAFALISESCEDKNPEELSFFFGGDNSSIVVTVGAMIDITSSSASCMNNRIELKGSSIKETGICWSSTNETPVYSDNHKSETIYATGSFNVDITGLIPNTTYYVRAYVKDSNGKYYYSEEVVKFTTIEEIVIADFSYSIVGLTVTFTNLSLNASTYSWNFGDGKTSTVKNPVHVYSTSNSYLVTLTAYGNSKNDIASKTISVSSGSIHTDITFTNNSFTTATIYMGSSSRTVASGETTTFSSVYGSSAYYSASTFGATSLGTQIGELVKWTNTLNLSGGTYSVSLDVPSEYFFIYITNTGTHVLNNMYVNYGLSTEKYAGIEIPANGTKYTTGYFKAFYNTNIRLYWKDVPTQYTYWNQGTQFTLPFVVNQYVELKNTLK